MRLGSCFVDAKGERCQDPFWTITDINDKNKTSVSRGSNKFRIFKNGIHFNFMKGLPGGNDLPSPSSSGNTLQEQQQDQVDRNTSVAASVAGGSSNTPVSIDKIFLDSVTYKVQILPQKYKIIKTPVHLYGELVKTEEGTQYLKQSNDIEFFK
jgi:hypothetical protein